MGAASFITQYNLVSIAGPELGFTTDGSIQAGDGIIALGKLNINSSSFTVGLPAGWTHLPNSPVGNSVAGDGGLYSSMFVAFISAVDASYISATIDGFTLSTGSLAVGRACVYRPAPGEVLDVVENYQSIISQGGTLTDAKKIPWSGNEILLVTNSGANCAWREVIIENPPGPPPEADQAGVLICQGTAGSSTNDRIQCRRNDGGAGALQRRYWFSFGSTAQSRHFEMFDLTAESIVPVETDPPVLEALSPASGTELATLTTPVTFRIVDASGLRLALLVCEFADRTEKLLAYDGARFLSPFIGSKADPYSAAGPKIGTAFEVLQAGGWTSEPTLTWYAIDAVGNDDTGASVANATDIIAPNVANISPAPGVVSADQALSFDIEDNLGLGLILVAAFIHATGEAWVIYDGTAILAPFTGGSSVTPSGNNLSFVVVPDDGWPGSVDILAFAVDSGGNVLP